MRLLAPLPLAVVRGLGTLLGLALYLLAVPRRRVVTRNLELCFPAQSPAQRRTLAVRTFVRFAQAWLDRSWLWHGDEGLLRARLRISGEVDALLGKQPVVLFAPHFVGLDAGWTALTLQMQRTFATIYTDQANKTIDAWILAGRRRFGAPSLFGRYDGVKPVVASLREGKPLYLLPDMNFGPKESIFVPFYGVPAATVPSLSRFARLGRASVVPVLTQLTSDGYEVRLLPAWQDFPTDDVAADTARMNRELQAWIDAMPAQYYWVHKRFKTRPPGEQPVY